ncbi:MAG: AAA family ATPase [Romboutsia sp.]
MISKELQEIIGKEFKGEAKFTKLSADMRGKVVVIYGGNNLGKTLQASKMKNPIFMPFEKGLNAVNGAMVLPTTSWKDARKNAKRLGGKKFLKLLQTGEQITIVIDGMESVGLYCRDYIASSYDARDIGAAKGGFGAWQPYEDEMKRWVDSIISLGYTVVFLGHRSLDKKLDKYVIKGDERNIAPIRDNADVVVYLEANGLDDEGKEIHSSGYLAESEDFFARSRFDYMDTYIEDFTAENLEKTIIDGIQREIDEKGIDNTTFEEQQEIYKDTNEMSIDEVKEAIREMYDTISDMGEKELDKYADIVEEHLGDVTVSEATNKQLLSLQCILDDLEMLIEELED